MGRKQPKKNGSKQRDFGKNEYEEDKQSFEYKGFEEQKEVLNGPLKVAAVEARLPVDDKPPVYTSHYVLAMEEKAYLRVLDFLHVNNRMYEYEVWDFFRDTDIKRTDWHESGRLRKDLISLSDKLPDALFKVEVYGEDRDDAFVAYARNGQYYEEPIVMVIPGFDYTKLKEASQVERVYTSVEKL